jgi:PPK2 family polyphosphate:nucleotide phosphotransferase
VRIDHDKLIVAPGAKVRLKDFDPKYTGGYLSREEAEADLAHDIERLAKYQDILYAQNTYALLVIFQAMDAAGKDGCIKHVMSGVNPQGCQVYSFKAPSSKELDHDYLWRNMCALPERGNIGIFNRSYYEEVLVVRVHPEILDHQQLPAAARKGDLWERRFEQIRNFEGYLADNGIAVVKFFLNVSKGEQKKRFLERIRSPDKNWKFSLGDVKERKHWKEYMRAYEEMLEATSTKSANWYVIPADEKWFARAAVADVIASKLKGLGLRYPKLSKDQLAALAEVERMLIAEK